MPQFNINPVAIFQFIQSLQPVFFYKWILLLLLIGYLIFHLIVFNQIRSLDKIVTQPLSSTILGFISVAFLVAGIGLFIFVFTIQV